MKVYFDTEFYENGKTIELISIGLVREDGKTYYAETEEAGILVGRDPWLRENVKLELLFEERKSRKAIAQEILEFVPENPEFWAYYADYDWVVLCQLYGRMIDLPDGWPKFCRDLKQFAVNLDSPKLPNQNSDEEHNALNDALWNKKVHEFLMEEERRYIYRKYA